MKIPSRHHQGPYIHHHLTHTTSSPASFKLDSLSPLHEESSRQFSQGQQDDADSLIFSLDEPELSLPQRPTAPSRKAQSKAAPSTPNHFSLMERLYPHLILRNGNTPLIQFVSEKKHEDVLALLCQGVNPNTPNRQGTTPLQEAIRQQDSDLVDILLYCKANPKTVNELGHSLLMEAAIQNNEQIAQQLIRAGAPINLQDIDGRSALMFATETQNYKMVQALIQAGANPNLQDNLGRNALAYAIEKDNQALAHVLLNHQSDPFLTAKQIDQIRPKFGPTYRGKLLNTLLPHLTQFQRQWLLTHPNINLNYQDPQGKTALMQAAIHNNPHLVSLLLANGADPTLKNKHGQTAQDLAIERDAHDALTVLEHPHEGEASSPTPDSPDPASTPRNARDSQSFSSLNQTIDQLASRYSQVWDSTTGSAWD